MVLGAVRVNRIIRGLPALTGVKRARAGRKIDAISTVLNQRIANGTVNNSAEISRTPLSEILSFRIAGQMDFDIFIRLQLSAGVAQLAEQLFCKQQVVGSSPSAGFVFLAFLGRSPESASSRRNCQDMQGNLLGIGSVFVGYWLATDSKSWIIRGGYRSGQTGQTVNLLAMPSQVRILHPPLAPFHCLILCVGGGLGSWIGRFVEFSRWEGGELVEIGENVS